MVSMMIEYNLYNTALRIINGCSMQVAINDHIHQWNRMRSRMLYLEEPPLSGKDYVDAWLAATAEYESFIIGDIPPQWTENTCRFLKRHGLSVVLAAKTFAKLHWPKHQGHGDVAWFFAVKQRYVDLPQHVLSLHILIF